METNDRAILIVDDELPFLELVKNYFTPRGVRVVTADTSITALNAMRKERFRLVLLDYAMPQIRGDDLMGMLQTINPSARFIIVSGVDTKDVEQEFKGLGYVAFFQKGTISLKDLENAVNESLAL